MLSRFSRLPGVGSLFNTQTNYSAEEIDGAVTEIKKIGRSTSSHDDTIDGITTILALMKKYSDSLHVQRVSCHALSNLAMQVVVARLIVQKGGFQLIQKCLLRFEGDHKLCWLGSSAVWNLARPPANRSIIGVSGVKLMLKMLKLHRGKEKVTNTSIGALSNLSLCDALKNMIAQQKYVELILSVLTEYAQKRSLSVMTSGAGLVANLAVSDDHATLMVKKNAIRILLQLLNWRGDNVDDTLYRNTCAALNNMVTATDFLDHFLGNLGVEAVFSFLTQNQNDLYTNLLENCLINIEVDVNEVTTSFHLCALHGRLPVLQKLMIDYPFTDLDGVDSKTRTCLDYAIFGKHPDVAHFLSKCGAIKYQSNIGNLRDAEERKLIENAITNGKRVLKETVKAHRKAVVKALPLFPVELCNLVVSYGGNVDMLRVTKKYE